LADTRTVHRRDRDFAEEAPQLPLARPGDGMVAPDLEVLTSCLLRLRRRGAAGKGRQACRRSRGQEITSFHPSFRWVWITSMCRRGPAPPHLQEGTFYAVAHP